MKTFLHLVRLPSAREQIDQLEAKHRVLIKLIQERDATAAKQRRALLRYRIAFWSLVIILASLGLSDLLMEVL